MIMRGQSALWIHIKAHTTKIFIYNKYSSTSIEVLFLFLKNDRKRT